LEKEMLSGEMVERKKAWGDLEKDSMDVKRNIRQLMMNAHTNVMDNPMPTRVNTTGNYAPSALVDGKNVY
jgi:hypothetical protein